MLSDAWITKVAHIVWENVTARIPPEDVTLLLATSYQGEGTQYFTATFSEGVWWDKLISESIEDMGYTPKFFARLPETLS